MNLVTEMCGELIYYLFNLNGKEIKVKSAKNTSNTITLIMTFILILGIGGWVANVYKLISNGFEIATWGGLEVARVIGVFVAPLGSVLGFI